MRLSLVVVGHGNAIVQMSIQPIIQQQAQNRSRDAGYNDLAPQTHHWPAEMPGKTGIPAIVGAERPQLFEIENDDRQNRAQLDDHAEHLHKLGAETEFKNLLRKDHVAGTGNRQPFGNALDDAIRHRAQKI